jgi:hypothetical protein
MKILPFAFLLSVYSLCPAQTYKGSIAGKVIDAKSQDPIPEVHVLVRELTAVGAASGANGEFLIKDLDVGTYSLRFSCLGYAPQILTNVVVATGRATPLLVKMDEVTIELEGVTAEGTYFSRAQAMSPLSSNVFNRAEILRLPGSVQDVQRVVQNLPGVASSTDNINELIVRGGASFENLTMLDGMEIPSINHYANQFNSAGPINMVNADMIEDCQFSAGGFPAQFGDKSSSVMNLTVREGNRNIGFSSKTGFNMAGIGTLVEGGFAGGRGSFIVSARNSLLELVDKIVGLSSISLTAVPRYWDAQSKIVYDLSPSNKIMVNVLYGDSRINLAGDPKEKDELRRNVIDSSAVEYLYPVSTQYAVGATLRSLWGKRGYSTFTLYTNGTSSDVAVRSDFERRVRGAEGEVLDHQVLSSRTVYANASLESFVGGKFDLSYEIHPRHELSTGFQILTSRRWQNDVYAAGDTSRFDIDRDGSFDLSRPIATPEWNFHQRIGLGGATKYGAYISDKFRFLPDWSLTFGLRYDHFTYSGFGSFSPRGSLSYQLVPGATTVTLAAGWYYQPQPFPYYADRRQIGYNENLEHMKAVHYVFGMEQIFEQGLKISLESYYKTYSGIAVSEQFIRSADKTFWSDRYLPVGTRTSYGLELFLEQKQVSDYFGTLSLSLSKTREKDVRTPALQVEYPSEFDYPVIVTLIGGGIVRGVRSWLDEAPFFLKYPSYILPFSDEMELSFKYRYQTGRPYTPKEYVPWKQIREGGVTWSRGAWIDSDDINSARYPDYSRLDLQWISRFNMRNWNINVFLAIQNVLNTKNVFYKNFRSDGTVETVYQFAFFPVGGVEVEF